MSSDIETFSVRLQKSLSDPNVKEGLLNFQRRWKSNRSETIGILEEETGENFESLMQKVGEAKRRARSSTQSLDRFKANAEAAGTKIIEAKDANDANSQIADILKSRGIDLVVKSKSMLTEEIFLNNHLQKEGILPVETDLGEWILQIDDDHPSHLVLPAVHKRRHQIAELYKRVLGQEFDPQDITSMARVVRTELRQSFLNAGAGITGGNILIAETGTLCLVTNEGNASLATSFPQVHIAVVGIDKLVSEMSEALDLLRLLSKSGTGQLFTAYVSMLTGPRHGQEQFIVIVDNGRTQMAKDPEFESALGCIRCGACANVCPPYQAVGGHGFGYVYTGAIGLINTAFHHGEEAASGPVSLCVSCGACAAVCPADIDLPHQILLARTRLGRTKDSLLSKRKVRLALQVWSKPRLFRFFSRTLRLLGPAPGVKRIFSKNRQIQMLPDRLRPPARKTLSQIVQTPKSRADSTGSGFKVLSDQLAGKKVVLFMQCISDQVAPEIAVASAKLIAATGAEVIVPKAQHCCGLPAIDAGDTELAQKMAEQTLEVFSGADLIVTPAPSCALAIAQDYTAILNKQDTVDVMDLISFLSGPGKLPKGSLTGAQPARLAAHKFCQSGTRLGHTNELADLIQDLTTITPEPLEEAEFCCGFGGFTSLVYPEVANVVLNRKLKNLSLTKAEIWLTDNPGCALHLKAGANAKGYKVEVLHIAEYLARYI